MKNIQLLNSISDVGLEVFDKTAYNVGAEVESPDGIMVRSAVLHDMQFPATLAAIAVAGVIYLVLILVTRAISREDLALMPKGDKIARLLHLR